MKNKPQEHQLKIQIIQPEEQNLGWNLHDWRVGE